MASLSQATSQTVESLGLKRLDAEDNISSQKPTVPPYNGLVFSRCPVPPISISPDSVNQFQNTGTVPQDRLISVTPLFTQQEVTGSISNTTNVSVSGKSISLSGTSGTTVTSATAAVVTNPISYGETAALSIQMAKSYLIYRVAVTSPARVRIYSTPGTQSSDAGRASSTPVVLGASTGVIGDLYLASSSESIWMCSPAITGFNGDDPQAATVYVSVTNLAQTTTPITVSFFYLPFET
jgi:hypothetical protein